MPKPSPPLHFDINPAVVFRLGDELITDLVQALVELVKNSYDADATWVNISIDTQSTNDQGRRYSDAKGLILVEDDGHGMDRGAIQQGWLTIANSPKLEDKEAGRLTPRGRTPIGDKGLGRLGTQKLARNVEFITRPSNDPDTEYYVAFSWTDFRTTSRLHQVRITSDEKAVKGAQYGTKLILSDLLEPDIWQAERSLQDLQRKLSGMLSPFQTASDFSVYLEVDGKSIELAEIAQRLRETAFLRYAFCFNGEALEVLGHAKLSYFQPSNRKEREYFRLICQNDQGEGLFHFLASKTNKNRPVRFSLTEREGWFVNFGEQRNFEQIPGLRRSNGQAYNPGPFRGEVDAVSLDSADADNLSIGRQSEYRQLVRDLAGIRVYRDGFGIRLGEDWLRLGRQWTGGSSYYGLRPGNVLGYVAISARDNPKLVETTSREGFQVTPHYENFYAIISEFVRFTGGVQEFLRRGVIDYLDTRRERSVGVTPEDPHSVLTQRIDDIGVVLGAERKKVQVRKGALRKATKRAADTLERVRGEFDQGILGQAPMSVAVQSLETEIANLSTTAAEVENVLEEVTVALERASELSSMRDVLDRRWHSLNDHVATLYESVSLGLTAEVLSHEIHNVASRLARRSTAVTRALRDERKTAAMMEYVEHVRSSVAAMRRQLSHLTPSLRYLREQREQILISSLLTEVAAFHNDRFSNLEIRLNDKNVKKSQVSVYMNKGKLTQIFDNLILNSEYWVKEAMQAKLEEQGVITLVVDGQFARVMDNGRGVDQSVEESLFQPFVTRKKLGEGRGLGLFVVQQLLDSETCTITLLPDRNQHGNKYIFEIDLSGAVNDR